MRLLILILWANVVLNRSLVESPQNFPIFFWVVLLKSPYQSTIWICEQVEPHIPPSRPEIGKNLDCWLPDFFTESSKKIENNNILSSFFNLFLLLIYLFPHILYLFSLLPNLCLFSGIVGRNHCTGDVVTKVRRIIKVQLDLALHKHKLDGKLYFSWRRNRLRKRSKRRNRSNNANMSWSRSRNRSTKRSRRKIKRWLNTEAWTGFGTGSWEEAGTQLGAGMWTEEGSG